MRKMLLTVPVFLLLSIFSSVIVLPGCGPFWIDPYICVRESALNWVSICYYNLARKPIRRIQVKIYGNGLVEVFKGKSQLVTNDFAKDFKDSSWDDFKTVRYQIDPKEANDIFQNLVNNGLLDREKTFKSSNKDRFDRFIAVKANINSNTYSDNVNMFEEDPDLAEELLDVVREFEHPSR